MGVFCCVWENMCMLNKKLHIFKGLIKIVVFFPMCKYFYSLCEVLSQCSVQVSVKIKKYGKICIFFPPDFS